MIRHLRSFTDAEIVIAEGTGGPLPHHPEVFEQLGQCETAAEFATTLIDLNTALAEKTGTATAPGFRKWFCRKSRLRISSSPCPCPLHSLAGITGSLKNMMDLRRRRTTRVWRHLEQGGISQGHSSGHR
ncbi:MAG: hypothetical protein R2860_16165 [Desulfobacterales bacterium]